MIIIPIVHPRKVETGVQLKEVAQRVRDDLASAGIAARVDDRDHLQLGAKYFEWERKVCAVPLACARGASHVAATSCTAAVPFPDEAAVAMIDRVHPSVWRLGSET